MATNAKIRKTDMVADGQNTRDLYALISECAQGSRENTYAFMGRIISGYYADRMDGYTPAQALRSAYYYITCAYGMYDAGDSIAMIAEDMLDDDGGDF